MSGVPESIQSPRVSALITTVRAYHPKSMALAFLLVAASFFGCSAYRKNHWEDEGMYFADVFLFFLGLIVLPGFVVRARQRMLGVLKNWGFLIFKGAATIAVFAFFHGFGKKLLAEKDVYVALSCIFFFLHLLYLQVIHQITDDLGIAQGVLFAAFTVLIAEDPKLHHVLWLSGAFTVLLAVMNTPQPAAAPEIPEVAAVIPEEVAVVIPEQVDPKPTIRRMTR